MCRGCKKKREVRLLFPTKLDSIILVQSLETLVVLASGIVHHMYKVIARDFRNLHFASSLCVTTANSEAHSGEEDDLPVNVQKVFTWVWERRA